MSNKKANFIIVDDSELDCFIADKILKYADIATSISSFLHASNALDYIKQSANTAETTIVLLDIVMPVMNGINFLEEFEKLPEEVRRGYHIVAFTSSMNKKDMNRIKSFKSVIKLLDKPLTSEALIELMGEIK